MAAVDPVATAADSKRFDPSLGVRNNSGPKGARWWREIGWRYVVGLLGIAFALMPAYFVVLASISPTATLQGAQMLPRAVTLDNYRSLFDETMFFTWLWNSLKIAGGAAVANMFLSAMAAYAFSRLRFAG
ncbi:MAG: sugar ABC transporter permease, partial [Nitriliruptoraceae bacterium]